MEMTTLNVVIERDYTTERPSHFRTETVLKFVYWLLHISSIIFMLQVSSSAVVRPLTASVSASENVSFVVL